MQQLSIQISCSSKKITLKKVTYHQTKLKSNSLMEFTSIRNFTAGKGWSLDSTMKNCRRGPKKVSMVTD
jgi:hypothetical protein